MMGTDSLGSTKPTGFLAGLGMAALALAVVGMVVGCAAPAEKSADSAERTESTAQGSQGGVPAPTPDSTLPIFEDHTAAAGLGGFRHFNGMTGQRLYSEMMGSGLAWIDFDRDGDLDLYVVQGRMVNPGQSAEAAVFTPPEPPWIDRLYRNELEPSGELIFTDVTAESGIVADGYGMGVAVGDVDNDGFPDLYVMNDGPDQLWRNRGDGTFEDFTTRASLGSEKWSVSAAFFDFDRDGDLDLFVVHYVDFSIARAKPCKSLTGMLDYCGPLTHPAVADRLYRNQGDGTFEDVTRKLGIVAEPAAGLGVVVFDFDDDGRLDLAVANDGMPNHLWHNRVSGSSGGFVEIGVPTGISVNQEGQAEAGMGIVAGDPDGDGDDDLLLTHLELETNTYYANDGRGGFIDRSRSSGLGGPSWDSTGFGVAFLDVDLDGRLDVAAVAGAVKVIPEQLEAGEPHPLKMHKQLYRNTGTGFELMDPEKAGLAFAKKSVGRGLAVGDVDNDGDSDLVISNNAGPLELLINRSGDHHSGSRRWLGLRLLDIHGRDALGATIISPRRVRIGTDGSYASARDPRRLVVLEADSASTQQASAQQASAQQVEIRWVDGTLEVFEILTTNQYTALIQGRGLQGPGPLVSEP